MGTRTLAVIAVAGQVAFIVAWAVAGVVEPGYSTSRQTVSELFSGAAERPWIMQAGLVALVPSYLAAAALARRAIGSRGAACAALLVLAAPLVVAVLLNPLACMTNAGGTCPAPTHYTAAVALQLTLAASPFAAAWALRGRRHARLALGMGVLGLLGILAFSVAPDGVYGIAQRAMFATVSAWIAVLARIGSGP